MSKAFTKHKMKSLPAAIIFAAGIGCALPSMAQTDGTEEPTPMSLLPQVFTRIDYLSVASTNDKETEQTSTSPLPAGNDVEYAEQDLDLALENFFYALEDLMQSASRYEASVETGEHNYFAQVQFPVQVMSSLATGRTSDQATNTATAAAQGSTTLPAIRARGESNPARLSEFEFSGSSSINLQHNDNIYTTRTNELSDQILRANIHGVAESRSRTRAVKFEGDIDNGNYNRNADNNYTDWSATSSYSTLLGARSKGFAGLGYFYHHEEKGVGSTDGDQAFNFSEPVEFESWVARGIYELGARQARTRIVADSKFDLLRTTNFQDVPEIKSRDRDISSFTGTAYYKWTQRLSYLAELRHMDVAYVHALNDNNLDSTQTRLALGAEWLATRKTAGSIRFGLQEKQFDNPENQTSSRISWEALVEWAPRPRT
ncbi:MAG: outer membrane beta-barrel protein, partial [Pseudomonadales bacterium]